MKLLQLYDTTTGTELAGVAGTDQIEDGSITYSKLQVISAGRRGLGRYDEEAGPVQEYQFGDAFTWDGDTLNVSTGGGMILSAAVNERVGGGITVPANTIVYIGHLQTGTHALESDAIFYLPIPGRLRSLYVRVSGAQPGSGDLTITARTDSADTGIGCVIDAGGLGGAALDVVHTFDTGGGEAFCFKLDNAASATSITITQLSLCF